jgi:hypothetical protein
MKLTIGESRLCNGSQEGSESSSQTGDRVYQHHSLEGIAGIPGLADRDLEVHAHHTDDDMQIGLGTVGSQERVPRSAGEVRDGTRLTAEIAALGFTSPVLNRRLQG